MKHGGKMTGGKGQVRRGSNPALRITHHALGSLACRLSIAACFLAPIVSARPVTADAQANPYQAIIGRNVFSLKPPPPPPRPEDLIKKQPPPNIKLQGLTTINGRRQVLFKAMMPAKPPERSQPQEVSFVMNEGERQGEIEVLEINEQTGTIKFSNHGETQLKNMKDDAEKPALGAPPPPMMAQPGVVPGLPPPGAAMNPSVPGTITTFGGTSHTIPQRPLRGSTANPGGLPALGGGAGIPATTQQTQQAQQRPLTPEEQIIVMELHRQNNDPDFPPMPPTPLTPSPVPK